MAGRSIHVRLDESSAAALDLLKREGLTNSGAVRLAFHEASSRRRWRSELAAEVEALVADPDGRAEMAAVRELMAALAPEH